MQRFIYVIIFIFIFILFKAFYLDSLPSEPDGETNATVEEAVTEPVVNDVEQNHPKESDHPTGWADKSERPIDQLGDSIADKFKGKL
ncbi:MAG: hypothetical protein V2A75_01420 [Pseudomonadota bacterium]